MERWVIYAIVSMLFAGLTSVLAKSGLKGISSDLGLAIRTAVVFILVTLNVTVLTGVKDFSNLTKNNLIFLALSGLTTSLSWIFYYRAMKEGEVSMVASIDKASIVVTILLSFLILKEPMTAKLLVGGVFILVGMMILIWK
ncbi:EamA family transporter [Cytophaga aurantiaca]|uniref:EamA family transporter n=1 Tax=Cytophaga aurantiaca TaxID=29530 RepID=UPI000378FB7B|nr:EamA family transporter [Cytophaga aurantiaca]